MLQRRHQLIGSNAVAHYETCRFYVDAAWAGVALACPEQREALHLDAINKYADGFSTNFHKWGGVNFDCSTLCVLPTFMSRLARADQVCRFVRDHKVLSNALDVTPAYLRSEEGDSGQGACLDRMDHTSSLLD